MVAGAIGGFDQARLYKLRVVAAILTITALGFNSLGSSGSPVMPQSECFRDTTFAWTAGANTYLLQNHEFTKKMLIFSSLGVDFMQITGLILLNIRFASLRLMVTIGIFYAVR